MVATNSCVIKNLLAPEAHFRGWGPGGEVQRVGSFERSYSVMGVRTAEEHLAHLVVHPRPQS